MGYKLETHVYRMLHNLSQKICARFFKYPVDVDAYECRDYYDVISRPMDLNTLKFNFREGKYGTLGEVENDLQLIVKNCQQYNGEGHALYKMSLLFQNSVDTQMSQILYMYEKEHLSLNYEFKIDQKELDLCDKRYFNAGEKTFMDEPPYYHQLSNFEQESEIIVKWLTDFINLKIFNKPSFEKIVVLYKSGILKTIDDIYHYIRYHLDVACHREFHVHFNNLMICLMSRESKVKEKKEGKIITIKIKIKKAKKQQL